ncbi:MAG: glycosyl hydrolase [Terriglobales bacterium]
MKQRLAAMVFLTFLYVSSATWAQISPEFFAMHDFSPGTWPTMEGIEFSSWRSAPVNIQWADINTSQGVYDFSQVDVWLADTEKYGQSMLYTVYYTPSWASACPTCACLTGGRSHNGGCYPPSDLNSDGSGSDQHLKDFITALMEHVGPGKIQYLEVWNEPNITVEFTGTVQQLVRMAEDVNTVAKSYDPAIQIVSPAETGDGPLPQDCVKMQYLSQYLAAGGGQYVDIIALHGYVWTPEDIITRVNAAKADMQQYGQSSKPIFVTEGSWALALSFPTEQQPGFSFRHYLSMLSSSVQRFYLMAFFGVDAGNLWNPTTRTLTPAGIAYQLYYKWLVGATMTQPCQAQSLGSPVWTCTFSRSGGYQAEAIWNTSLPWGQTSEVTVPDQYTQYRDLYSNVTKITNHQVPIGYDPIWLEN